MTEMEVVEMEEMIKCIRRRHASDFCCLFAKKLVVPRFSH